MPNYRKGKKKNKNKNRNNNNNNKSKQPDPAKEDVENKGEPILEPAVAENAVEVQCSDEDRTLTPSIESESTNEIDDLPDPSDLKDLLSTKLVIQEVSDISSIEDGGDNQPIIYEADSEGNSTDGATSPSCESRLQIIETETVDLPAQASQSQDDLKARKAQKRIELETHFLPQLLNPRFLDSIQEEGSDLSDFERRGENKLSKSPKIGKHVNREETFQIMVEAKIIDREQCALLSTNTTPESEAAEMVYINSASSSASDLMDLTNMGTPTCDLVSVVEKEPMTSSTTSSADEQTKLFYVSSEKEDDESEQEEIESKNTSSCSVSRLVSPDASMQPTTTSGEEINCSDDASKRSELLRAKSFESNCSEESYSTTHSQCTAINTASFSDFSALTNMSDDTDGGDRRTITPNGDNNNSTLDPKNLRSICVETLSSMPYGNVVLENLAITAESLQTLLQRQETQSRNLEQLLSNKEFYEQEFAEKQTAENNRLLEIIREAQPQQETPPEEASKLNKFLNTIQTHAPQQSFTPDDPLPAPPPPPLRPAPTVAQRPTPSATTTVPPKVTPLSTSAPTVPQKPTPSAMYSPTATVPQNMTPSSTYSSYESSSTTSFKATANDQVIADNTSTKRESFKDHNGQVETSKEMHREDNLPKMMSDVEINKEFGDKTTTTATPPAKPLNNENEFKEFINRSKAAAEERRREFFSDSNSAYDEFRQRAKEMSEKQTTAAAAATANAAADNAIFNYDDIFKDFDALSVLLKEEADRPKTIVRNRRNFSYGNRTCAKSELDLFSKYDDILSKPISLRPKSEVNMHAPFEIPVRLEKGFESRRSGHFEDHHIGNGQGLAREGQETKTHDHVTRTIPLYHHETHIQGTANVGQETRPEVHETRTHDYHHQTHENQEKRSSQLYEDHVTRNIPIQIANGDQSHATRSIPTQTDGSKQLFADHISRPNKEHLHEFRDQANVTHEEQHKRSSQLYEEHVNRGVENSVPTRDEHVIPIQMDNGNRSPSLPPPPPPPPQKESSLRLSMNRELYNDHHHRHKSPFDGPLSAQTPTHLMRHKSPFQGLVASNHSNSHAQKYLSCQNFEEWTKFLDDVDFKTSTETISRPLRKEVEICLQSQEGKRAPIRAPRLSTSSTDLSQDRQNYYGSFPRWNFVANAGERVPPTMMHSSQESVFHKKSYKMPTAPPSRQPPVIPEENSISEKMAEEWLNKIAEREERRLQKIIKISKMKNDPYERRSAFSSDIGDEFLKRVKERRTKLCIPSDSELESGTDVEYSSNGKKSETDEPVKIIDGQAEADVKRLPRHMREFVKFTKEVKFEESSEKSTNAKVESSTKRSETTKEEESQQAIMFSPKFKAKPPPGSAGIWTPHSSTSDLYQPEVITEKPAIPLPSPMNTRPIIEDISHDGGSKEFRPMQFDSPVLPRRYVQQDESILPPWASSGGYATNKSPSCGELTHYRRDTPTQFGSTSSISQKIQQFEKSSSFTDLNRPIRNVQNGGGFVKPNEVIYSLKNEYMSEPECENDKPKKMAQLGRRKFEGIGPTTKEGMPIVLRSEVNQPNQHQWYKRIFQTLHKPKYGGRYPYKSSGYLSEPDTYYDSDYYTMNDTLDRRRATGNIGQNERSLREQGYESDSHVVFRKKDESDYSSKLNTINQRETYKAVQAGAEPPLFGFRKPAPEKPKDNFDNFDVIPITSTLHKIQIHDQNSFHHHHHHHLKEEAIILSNTNPFRTNVEAAMSSAKGSPTQAPKRPPAPPERAVIRSNVQECKRTLRGRHETCMHTSSSTHHDVKPANKYATITLRKRDIPIARSKSAGSANKLLSSCLKDKSDTSETIWRHRSVRMSSVSPVRASTRLLSLRKTSPVAFGRSISKERTFAEEKKRIEESQLVNRRSFCASTNILRDPNLKSPDEVKKAVRSYAIPLRRSKSSPRPGLSTFHESLVPPHQIYTKITTYSQGNNKSKVPKISTHSSLSLDKKTRLHANSTLSIAQTSSTFSIDSCGSKGKTVASKKSLSVANTKTVRSKTPVTCTYTPTYLADEVEKESLPTQSIKEKAKFWNAFSTGDRSHHESRSLSPSYRRRPQYRYFQEISKYHSISKVSDEESEFSDHSPDLEWNYEQRSLSETRATPRKFSPTREVRVPPNPIRSPSRRRIQSCKDNRNNESKNIIRASSLSSADKKAASPMHKCDHLSHSASSLNYLEGHGRGCEFSKSQRFIDLNRFYNTLERVGQLELATSSTNLKPIRKEDEVTDYAEWKKIRTHERAEKELNYLVSQLKMEQKQNDFLFRPRDVEDVKWRETSDFGLRAKEKSVEDFRETFENKIKGNDEKEQTKQNGVYHRDDYKTLWRGNSVANLAASLEMKYNVPPCEKDICLSNHLMSTLSREQITQIRKQLNEIYTPAEQKQNGGVSVSDKYVITVNKSQRKDNGLTVRSNSTITKKDLLGSTLEKKQQQSKALKWCSMPEIQPDTKMVPNVAAGGKVTESTTVQINDGKCLSETIMQEIKEKALEFETRSKHIENETRSKQPVQMGRETRGAIAAQKAKKTLPEAPVPPPLPKVLPPAYDGDSLDYEYVDTQLEEVDIPDEAIQRKIQYFEEKQNEEIPKTIYHAREYSSPDEEEVMKTIVENRKIRQEKQLRRNETSLSATDLRDFFGEKPSMRTNFCIPRPPPAPNEKDFTPYRSRSLSPAPPQTHVAHLHKVQTGEVKKIRDQLEEGAMWRTSSDPELTLDRPMTKSDVSWIAHNFELNRRSRRGRGRKVVSPIPKATLNKENLLMPHIDIISKTAALKEEMYKKFIPMSAHPSPTPSSKGKVKSIRCQFENGHHRHQNGARRRSTSDPDISKTTNDIANYLKGVWIAHKFPKQKDNTINGKPPPSGMVKPKPPRNHSTSPPRAPKFVVPTITIQSTDVFAHQKYDPAMHRPKARYVPDDDSKEHQSESRKKTRTTLGEKKLKEIDEVEPSTRSEKVVLNENGYNNRESPSRYIETDVNIHYKTPIRYEYKEVISEDELAYRQAESMKKLYQEEKRQKYLKELQELNARRHTDNFTPSQKSPIPLNRYDDFLADLAPKSPIFTNTIARALYNFQGQTSRELSFKKGDLIVLRRMVDDNWYDGEHNGQKGLLPVKYVEIITQESFIKKRPKTPSEGQARAKFNFQAQSGIELSLNKGELVTLTRRVDKNWYEGKIANRKGIFPCSYVEVLTDIGADDKLNKSQAIGTPSQLSPEALRTSIYNDLNNIMKASPSDTLRQAKATQKTKVLHVDTHSDPIHFRAIYRYRPQNNDELELQEGDIVHVLEICDDGWFVGTSQRTGCFGTFPGNYVERV